MQAGLARPTANLTRIVWVLVAKRGQDTRYLTVPYQKHGVRDPIACLCIFDDFAEATSFADSLVANEGLATPRPPSPVLSTPVAQGRVAGPGDLFTESLSLARAFRTAASLGLDAVIAGDSRIGAYRMMMQLEFHAVSREPALEPQHFLSVCWDREVLE